MIDLSGIRLPAAAERDPGPDRDRDVADVAPQIVDFALLLDHPLVIGMAPPAGAGTAEGAARPLPGALGAIAADGESLPPGGHGLPSGSAERMGLLSALLARSAAAVPDREALSLPPPARADSAVPVLSGAGSSAAPAAGLAPSAAATGSAAPWQPLTPGSQTFETALGQRLLWMAGRGVQHARLQAHPEHLGPIDIRLRLDGDQAQLLATATAPLTRDALEQAVPRLREQLAEAGVMLTQADVSDRRSHERGRDERSHWPEGDFADPHEPATGRTLPRGLPPPGLLDLFA